VETITEQYVTEKYSPHGADVAAAETAWHGVRFKLWHDAIQSWLLVLLEDGEDEDPLGLTTK
jgi:hypothetical protein